MKMNVNQDPKTKKVREKKSVAYYKLLFSFSDSTDHILMLVGTIGAIGNGICLPLLALLLGELANSSFQSSTTTKQVFLQVSKVCLKYVYLAAGNGLAAFFQVSCWAITGERQAARIRSLYLRSILRQEIGFFDNKTTSGEIILAMSGDSFLVQEAIGEKVGKFIQVTASFLGGFVIAFAKGWLLTLVLLSSVPPIVISTSLMFFLLNKLTIRAQSAYNQAGIVVEQTLTSIRTVISFTGEMRAIEKYGKSIHEAYKSGVHAGLATGIGGGLCALFLFSSYGFALWYGARLIIEKGYTGEQVINVIVATLTGSYSMGQASPCLSAFSVGKTAAFKMFETIRRKPEIDPNDNHMGITFIDGIKGDIELKNVDFSYPSRPDELVFKKFSLVIPRGTIAALVGQSGSGKSTVINLIERFYDPISGEVLIDGIDIKSFNLGWIRDRIGLVSQEPILFTSSIRDNIAYGKDGASLEEIKSAIGLANAASFIDKLPQGLDTMVGEHGTQLSGGQKQRIAIARAILKEPSILLLDEATSALDAESERVVQEALDRVMINCTTIVVAHRLGTIKNVGMIAVIHQGKIIEKGTHAKLIEDPEGAYCRLIRLQQMNKESEANDALCNDMYGPDINLDSHGHSSQKVSVILPSSSHGSSENGRNNDYLPPAGKDNTAGKSKITQKEGPIRRLARLNKPEIPIIIVGLIATAILGVIQPLFGLAFASMIKIFYEPRHKLQKDSRFWALIFCILGIILLLATTTRSVCFAIAGCRLIKRIRLMCFEKVVHMDISWFEKGADHTSGVIGARLSMDATLLRGLVGDTLSLVVQSGVAVIAGIVIAFQASWLLAIIVLVIIPLVGFNGYLSMKFMGGFGANDKKLHEQASQVASDAIGGIRTVISFCAEERVIKLYEMKCEAPIKAGKRHGLISGAVLGFSLFLMYLAYALSFYAGSRLVEAGKVSFTEVFRVFFVLSMTTVYISILIAVYPDSTKAKIAAKSIFKILDSDLKINSRDDSGIILDTIRGDIELRRVCFKYPARPDAQIFKDLYLTMPAGKVVALVGESGSGKSTVISLLLRFYDPDSGVIELDGVEIGKLQLKWLRQQIGVVSQEPVLFNETIRANISYGKEGTTEAEIVAAAELANAHNFISTLQQGYDTIVGERGIQLSGGQKQRVAIARAIVKSPKILLLDEATSALDAESEKVVQDALDKIMVARTTVVVAHRLSTIKNADLIAVVRNGQVVEKGKHEELIDMEDGVYASLVALQTSSSTWIGDYK